MSDIGKLTAIGTQDFSALITEALKGVLKRFQDDDVNWKVAGGEASKIVRFKLIAKAGEGQILRYVVDVCCLVAFNGYRIAGKNFTGPAQIAIAALGIKIGGVNNRRKPGYTLVACLAAFPDVCAEFCVLAKDHIGSRPVGGWRFAPNENQFPHALFFNGTHSLAIYEDDQENDKAAIATAILAHQGCYISSRALAGTKKAPDADKIKGGRKKQYDFIVASGNIWPKEDKEKVMTRLKTTHKAMHDKLVAIGKACGDFTAWPTDAATYMDSIGKHVGWIKG